MRGVPRRKIAAKRCERRECHAAKDSGRNDSAARAIQSFMRRYASCSSRGSGIVSGFGKLCRLIEDCTVMNTMGMDSSEHLMSPAGLLALGCGARCISFIVKSGAVNSVLNGGGDCGPDGVNGMEGGRLKACVERALRDVLHIHFCPDSYYQGQPGVSLIGGGVPDDQRPAGRVDWSRGGGVASINAFENCSSTISLIKRYGKSLEALKPRRQLVKMERNSMMRSLVVTMVSIARNNGSRLSMLDRCGFVV